MGSGLSVSKGILIGILVGIVVPVVFFFAIRMGSEKERNYVNNGVLTSCTVDTVLTVGGKQQVMVVYTNDKGQEIKAKATLNKKVHAGQSVKAYVLASDPYEVYYPASPFLKWILYAIIAAVAIGGWIPLFLAIRQNKIDKLSARMKAMNRNNDDYF